MRHRLFVNAAISEPNFRDKPR